MTAIEGEVLSALQCADLRGERTREALEGEVDIACLRQLTDLAGERAREGLPVGAVLLGGSRITIPPHAEVVAAIAEVEGIELGELADGGRYLARQAREAQTQRAQVGQLIELGGDGTRELAVVLQLERAQSGELADALRQGATELVAAEVEGGDTRCACDVAYLDACPSSYGARAIPVVGVRPVHPVEALVEVYKGEAVGLDRPRDRLACGELRSASAGVASGLRRILLLLAAAGDDSTEGNKREGREESFLHFQVNIK